MKRRGIYFYCILIVLTFGNCFSRAQAQCGQLDIFLARQGEVDSFSMNYPGCHYIQGSLFVEGNDITNLAGLHVLDSIHVLNISNCPHLKSFQGLENLRYTEGLNLIGLDSIKYFQGFQNFKECSATFFIFDLPLLESFHGLDSLLKVGELDISTCPKFKNLDQLGSLQSVERIFLINNLNLDTVNLTDAKMNSLDYLIIESCPKFKSFGSFPKLQHIGYLTLDFNSNLLSLSGLDSIEQIDQLRIDNNKRLGNINGLKNLKSIQRAFVISNNILLGDISAIKLADLLSMDSLVIVNNASLAYCNLPNICAYIDIPTTIAHIEKNAAGCIDRANVSAQCHVLGLELISFEAEIDNSDILISGKIQGNNEDYVLELEHSHDNMQWKIIDALSITNFDFKYLHGNVDIGDHYYRIKITNKHNGEINWSKIRSVKMENKTTTWFIRQGKLEINTKTALAEFIICTPMGQLVDIVNFANGKVEYTMTKLPKGLYIIQINWIDGKKEFVKLNWY